MIQLLIALCLSVTHPVSNKAYCSHCEQNMDRSVTTVIPSQRVGSLLRKRVWWTSCEGSGHVGVPYVRSEGEMSDSPEAALCVCLEGSWASDSALKFEAKNG
jgi:hypothetical protein